MAGKGDELIQTTLTYLDEIFIEVVHGRHEETKSKYLEKGKLCEIHGFKLLDRVRGVYHHQYKGQRLKNDFISGMPDCRVPHGLDVKVCWDLWTYYNANVEKDNEWQGIGYAWLDNQEQWIFAKCLVDTPDHLIEREKRSLFYEMKVEYEDDPDYQMAVAQLIKNSKFEDIPEAKRVKEFIVKRDKEKEELIKKRVVKCRQHLNELYNKTK